jgi:hypothetical protein
MEEDTVASGERRGPQKCLFILVELKMCISPAGNFGEKIGQTPANEFEANSIGAKACVP